MIGAASVPRRGFLKRGILGGVLLAVGGATGLALRPTRLGSPAPAPLALFSPAEYAAMAAIAARIVPGDDAPPTWPSAAALDCAGKIDRLLALAHPSVGTDFKRLIGLFENGLAGLLIHGSGTPFTQLDAAQQAARLKAWRHSRLMLLRSGYQALVRLVHATYYSSPAVYALIGYPGPPVVPV